MHRPDPFTHPRETAKGLKAVLASGKVKHIAVSNYFPEQTRALQAYLDGHPLVSNQISISLSRLEPIYEGELPWLGSGVLDFCMAHEITPLAYSPLGKGWLSGKREVPEDHPSRDILVATIDELKTQAEAKGATPGQVANAWLLSHPSGIIPLVGSNTPDHIREAAGSVNVPMPREDWYRLWKAARGKGVM
jgi:predicted oxidoreductase